MAQIVEIIGVGPVEFPDGMSKDEMAAALKKLPKPTQPVPPTQVVETAPTPTQPTPSQGFNVLEASKAALSRQQTQRVAEKTAEKAADIPFEQLYKDPANLKKIQDYASLRFGKTGQPQAGESAADYVDRFARHMRFINTNEINYFTEQDWINNSKPEDVLKAGEAYALFDKTAGFLSKGGQNPLKAVSDYIAGVGSAPSTVASLGVGKAVTGPLMSKAMSQGLKKAVVSKTGAIGIGAPLATETSTNVLSNVYSQKRELSVADAAAKEMRALLPQLSDEQQKELTPQIEQIEKQVAEGINVGEAALTGAITAPISLAVEVGPLALAAKGSTKFLKGNDFTLNEILDARKKQLNIAKAPDALTGNKDADNVAVTTTNIYDGGDLLDEQGAPTAIAQMQVKNSLDKQADLIAASIWKQMPDTAPKPGEQTFEAVQRTLQSFDSLPDNVIKQSLEDAGTDIPNFLTRLEAGGLDTDALEKFSAMYGVSTSDAARTLQSKSVISRMINTMRNIDKESAKAVDALMGKPDPTTGNLAAFKGFVDRVDRNMITGMTTNMATVMRNAFGVGVNSTYGAVEEGLESLLFNTGRKLAGEMRGSPVKGDIGRGIYGAIDDTVDTWFYLGQQGLAKDITEEALKNNPMLMSKMLATAEEMKQTDLIAPIRILNTPAVLMDNYIRRAVFASSIDYHMRQTGLNLFDVMAQGKNIPIDILRKGVDDALEFTFSKTPTEGLGMAFVKGVEAARPLSTTVFPFARFLANATKWTWKHYNPGITAGMGAADMIRGVNMLRNGDEAGQALLMQGSSRIAQQATGAATLIAAYKYREENQDTPWNIMKSDDGTTVDAKYLFPFNVPLAIGDFLYKTFNGNPEDFKTKDLVEALTGFKAVGTQGQMLDVAREATSSIAANFTGDETDEAALNKMNKASAEFVGTWLGRATVPLNQFSDLISAFDNNESMQRDIFVTQPGEKLSGADIIGRSIQKGIPILKQALPEYQPATREKAAPRDTGPFKQMTGLALIPPKNQIETEIERLSIPYQVVFKTTGDKTVDSQARKFMAENIEASLLPYLQSDEYKNATREGQFGELKNRLSELQNKAKDTATKQYIQEYYDREQVPPIEQKKFEALDPKTRKATTELYKQQMGKSLTEDTDFRKFGIALELSKVVKRAPLAVQENKPGFAAGGAVSKQALKKAGKSSLLDQTMSLLQQVRKDAGIDNVPVEPLTPSPAIDQTAKMLMGKKPVVPKPAAKPAPAPTAAPTEEALPTPPAQTIEAPTPSKAFADEDYIKGEEMMKEQFDEDYLTNWKIANPNDYANTLHSYTGMAKGLKTADMPPPPFANKVDDTIEYDMAGKEIKQGVYSAADEVDDKLIKFERVNGAEEGDLNKKFTKPKALDKLSFADQADVTEQRNNILMTIKQDRKDQFKQFRKSKDFDMFDDEALAVMQGDFRVKNNRELDLKKDREAVLELATNYQKQLDDLRVKYKDTPPVKLYHGGMDVSGIKSKGFFDPQSTTKNYHQEMLAGGPSFTRDLNFNFNNATYGGTNPSNFVYTEVPYADYVFTKVNMTTTNYDAKDLNTIAQSINGSPYVARPVSLPRASYYEKEDMIPEANKLIVKDATSNIEKLVSAKPTGFGGRPNPKAVVTPDAMKEAVKQTRNVIDDAVKSSSGKEAYFAYNSIRDLMQRYASMGANVQTKGGIGQQYGAKINTFSDMYPNINKIANILEASGSKQRAETLKNFTKLLQKYNDIGGSATEEAARVKDLNAIFEFVPKLAKGGLASRR
jgi:uncharacterized protein YoaH (UPF0181 family)